MDPQPQTDQAGILDLARQIVKASCGKEFRRAMLCLVGEGRSGKTALSNSLCGKDFAQTCSTVGIDATRMEVSTTNMEAGMGGRQWKTCEQKCELDEAQARLAASRIQAGKSGASLTDSLQQGRANMLDLLLEQEQLRRTTLDKQRAADGEGSKRSDHSRGGETAPSASAAMEAPVPPPSVAKLNEELVLKYLNNAEIDDPVKLCMWDFGGQDVFYSLHHLFLKRFAVYLVCFNMKCLLPTAPQEIKASCLAFLRFWLNSCAVHAVDPSGDSSPVMLVGTHKDVVASPADHEKISELLYGTFHDGTAWRSVRSHQGQVSTGKGLLWFYPVDNTMSAGDEVVQQLMGDVHKCILEEEYTKRKVPFSWLDVYDKISSDKRTSISLNEFQEIARQCGLPASKTHTLAEECMLLLKMLDSQGVVLYRNEYGLKDLVILNPAEFLAAPATKVICQFIEHDLEEHKEARAKMPHIFTLLTTNGVLDRRLLPILWRDFREHIKELELLLVKFGLMIPLMQGGESSVKASGSERLLERFLVPTLLCKKALSAPQEGFVASCYCVFADSSVMSEWLDADCIRSKRVHKEGFLPTGVFARILGKAVVWFQYTTGSSLSELDISACEASLRFGPHFLMLQELPRENCIRILLFTQRPLVVIDALKKQISDVISECVPNLGYAFCVPQDGGLGLAHTSIEDCLLVFLDGPKGLTAHDAKGKDMQIGRGPESLVPVTRLREKFSIWLPPTRLRDMYDVFISYRWGNLDSELAQALFAILSREIMPEADRRGVEVFRDRERLETGRSFQKDFVQALMHSAVVVPIVSCGALKRMLTLDVDSDVDNVLLEWMVIVELCDAGKLLFCVPIMLGEELEATRETRSLVSNLFAIGMIKRLPNVVCSKVVAMAESLLKNQGVEPSEELKHRTVRQTVEKISLYLGVLAWDVTSSHGGRVEGAGDVSAAHEHARLKAALYSACKMAIMEKVYKAAADPLHQQRCAPRSPRHHSPEQTSPVATYYPRPVSASSHESIGQIMALQEELAKAQMAALKAEAAATKAEADARIAALKAEADAQMAALKAEVTAKAEADARVAKAQHEIALMQAKAQSGCCSLS